MIIVWSFFHFIKVASVNASETSAMVAFRHSRFFVAFKWWMTHKINSSKWMTYGKKHAQIFTHPKRHHSAPIFFFFVHDREFHWPNGCRCVAHTDIFECHTNKNVRNFRDILRHRLWIYKNRAEKRTKIEHVQNKYKKNKQKKIWFHSINNIP